MSIYQQNDVLRVVWNRLLLHPMACEEDRLIVNKVFEQSLNPEPGTTALEKVDQWLREHAYALDDIVLGGAALEDDQLPDFYELLDTIRPGWREIFGVVK